MSAIMLLLPKAIVIVNIIFKWIVKMLLLFNLKNDILIYKNSIVNFIWIFGIDRTLLYKWIPIKFWRRHSTFLFVLDAFGDESSD